MQTVSNAIRKLVRPGSQPRDREPLFKVGTLVRLKSSAPTNGFTCWGRGKGVGKVVSTEHGDIDVRWPAGRCYENAEDLYVVTR